MTKYGVNVDKILVWMIKKELVWMTKYWCEWQNISVNDKEWREWWEMERKFQELSVNDEN